MSGQAGRLTVVRLTLRGLRHYRTMHLVAGLALAIAALVISGSLQVAHSVQQSLKTLALRRIGPTRLALIGRRLVSERATRSLTQLPHVRSGAATLIVPCVVSVLDREGREQAVAAEVNLIGVSEPLLRFLAAGRRPAQNQQTLRKLSQQGERPVAAVNRFLARELGIDHVPARLMVRTQVHSTIPREFVLGRKDRVLKPGEVVQLVSVLSESDTVAELSLRPGTRPPMNVYVPLPLAQQWTDAAGQVNTVLLNTDQDDAPFASGLLRQWGRQLAPEDIGLRFRIDSLGYVALESQRMVLHPEVVAAAKEAAEATGARAAHTAIQVATSIRVVGRKKEIPYSVVAALDPSLPPPLGGLTLVDGQPAPALGPDEVYLNTWAAEDLAARPGETIELSYFVSTQSGTLVERSASFRLKGVVRMVGLAADPDLVPQYKGLTDARRMSEWDAPFPVDFRRIRPVDEQYWAKYTTTPKAFVSPEAAERLWRSRWGVWTSIRFTHDTLPPDRLRERLADALMDALALDRIGLAMVPVRRAALAAAQGSTDFRGLFLGFSMFLLAAGLLLTATLLRLFVTQRLKQIGLLYALGFTYGQAFRILLYESLPVLVLCAAAGAFGGAAYAAAMIAALRTRWHAALRLYELSFYFDWWATVIGALAALLLALPVYSLSLRSYRRLGVRDLLAGRTRLARLRRGGRRERWLVVISGSVGLLAVILAILLDRPVAGFFTAGVCLLIAGLLAIRYRLAQQPNRRHVPRGAAGLFWLGARGARYAPGRTMLIVSLVACAAFMLVAVGANRHEPEELSADPHSGHGGFAIIGTTTVPLFVDLNDPDAREELAIDRPDDPFWQKLTIYRIRYRPGDDTSCLNVYRPTQPTLIGVPPELRQRDGFRFAATAAASVPENPWMLLRSAPADDAVPCFADDQTATWILHLAVGDTLAITDDRGQPAVLKLVATLRRSVFQSELLIAEEDFLRLFPFHEGYRMLLVDCPPEDAPEALAFLERQLAPYGFDGMLTVERLAQYYAVENTYLDTFALLGGLGLLLGTLGLGTVLWRSVLERAGELALLRAVGFGRWALAGLVVSESAWLMLSGIALGAAAAVVAVMPQLLRTAESLPLATLSALLVAVFLTGIVSSLVAVVVAVRLPIVQTLRRE